MILMVNPPCWWMKMDEIQGLGPFRPIPKNPRDASCAIAEVAVKARAAARQKAPAAPPTKFLTGEINIHRGIHRGSV